MFLKPDIYTAMRKKVFKFTFRREQLHMLNSCDRVGITRPSIFPAMQRLGYSKAMTFSEFVELTCELSLDSMDVHTQPQTFLISDSKGRLPDYIGCLEKLETDWERLSELMEQRGIPFSQQLPHLNRSQALQTDQPEPGRLPDRVRGALPPHRGPAGTEERVPRTPGGGPAAAASRSRGRPRGP